jgi:hypothetical protein
MGKIGGVCTEESQNDYNKQLGWEGNVRMNLGDGP